jgi:DNA-binding NarL/FixJ family response regulator
MKRMTTAANGQEAPAHPGGTVDSGLVRTVLAAIRGDVLLTGAVLRRFAADGPEPERLTGRESEVRSLVERGLPDKKIASVLGRRVADQAG